MRFCMATTFYPPFSYGGDATYVQALARGLVKLGHHVEVIACTDAYRLRSKAPAEPEEESDDGVVVHRLEAGLGKLGPLLVQQTGHPSVYSRQLKHLLEKRFDVLHFHNISLLGGPSVLGMGDATVRLMSLHEHWLICPTHILWKNRSMACDGPTCFTCSIRSGIPPQLWRYTGARDAALDKVDCLLAASDYSANRHRAAGITRPIEVLPLFSPVEASGDVLAPQTGCATFLFVGRVTASKGVEQLLRVGTAMPDVRIEVIGSGDLLPSLQSRYAGAGEVQFFGRLDQHDLVSHYRRATALVLPSAAPETFGLAVVEAAACGTPAIVSSASGGAREIVEMSGGGLVYDGDDGLAQAMKRLRDDPELRAELGRSAKAAYSRLYTQDRHLSGYVDIVTRLASMTLQQQTGSSCAL